MTSALGSFAPFYYYPLGNVCPAVPPLLRVEKLTYGRCGPGIRETSCSQCCSRDVCIYNVITLTTLLYIPNSKGIPHVESKQSPYNNVPC
jgi:hypothetical protein